MIVDYLPVDMSRRQDLRILSYMCSFISFYTLCVLYAMRVVHKCRRIAMSNGSSLALNSGWTTSTTVARCQFHATWYRPPSQSAMCGAGLKNLSRTMTVTTPVIWKTAASGSSSSRWVVRRRWWLDWMIQIQLTIIAKSMCLSSRSASKASQLLQFDRRQSL